MTSTPAPDRLAPGRREVVRTGLALIVGGVVVATLGPVLLGVDVAAPWWGWALRVLLGALAGAAAAWLVVDEAGSLEVHDDHLVARRGRDRRRVAREETVRMRIDTVGVVRRRPRLLVEGGEQVLLDRDLPLPPARVAAALRAHGWPCDTEID